MQVKVGLNKGPSTPARGHDFATQARMPKQSHGQSNTITALRGWFSWGVRSEKINR